MNNKERVAKKIADIEATIHYNPEMAAVHAAVMSGYAYSASTAISEEAIEAALFGERMSTRMNDLAELERTNMTSRRSQRSVLKAFETNAEVNQMKSKKSSVLARFKKHLQRDHGVTFMKIVDEFGNIKRCIPLCRESCGQFIQNTMERVDRARDQEKVARSNGNVVGMRYKKIIPDETDDE